MGFPQCRKLNDDTIYTWDFSILEPLAPIRTKMHRRYFDDLKEHPSGRIVGLSSVGTRAHEFPSSQLVFPLSLDLTLEQTEALSEFFSDSAFWFFPDSDIDVGYLTTYFPREFSPQPTPNARFLVTGSLVQIDKRVLNIESVSTDLDIRAIQFSQQANVRSGISLWINDNEHIDNDGALLDRNVHAIYIFPESEAQGSDWTLLDNHFVRHETNFIDRYDRILFNWVRAVKKRYTLNFRTIDEDFMQKLVRFTAQRYGRFYTNVDTRLADDTLTDYILPPYGADLPYINVRVVEPELPINYYNELYDTTITLEEI